jgi:hypothetical protein
MRSVDDKREVGGGWRYAALNISSGISGCDPVTANYGEQPMHL